MTLEEKIGQLNQYSGRKQLTGPLVSKPEQMDELQKGWIGSILNVNSAERTREMQRIAVEETRLGIPLLFALDVIHGYKTIFPIPLAEAASWDLKAIENGARVAAREAAAAGIHWTFAPMVDVARDPRWGRVMEGAGEDAYYGALVAQARVKGFQGSDLSAPDTIAACAKHFVGYGLVNGGREYNNVDVSWRQLRQFHMPAFRAAADAGVATFMTSFNDINGVPASASKRTLRDILRGEWAWNGLVVSDWNSIGEMLVHRFVKTKAEAAKLALEAGVDIDMEARAYVETLADAVRAGDVSESLVTEAAARVLLLKHKLGLFDDPYRYVDAAREKATLLNADHLAAARDMAAKSMVLLKNDGQILPLNPDKKQRILVVGALADSKRDMLGPWIARGESDPVITPLAGIQAAVKAAGAKGIRVDHVSGGSITETDPEVLEKAAKAAERAARRADVIVAVLGEDATMSGEAASRTSIEIPTNQKRLLQRLVKTGKPVVLVLMNGRPLALSWEAEHVTAMVEAWFPGTQAGHALADVLFGKVNPSAKLTMSFPRNLGQVPVFYNHQTTGRPKTDKPSKWVSRYIDAPNTPLYPFGYGLSYTTYSYGDLKLSQDALEGEGEIEVSFTVTNTGTVAGEEVAQMYIRDEHASIAPPERELKGFEKVALAPGEVKTVRLTIDRKALSFWNQDMAFAAEPGEFTVFVGGASNATPLSASFKLVD